MRLYDAENESYSLNDMSIMLAAMPNSTPVLLNKVREVAKNLAMNYPISWREIANLSLIRRIQLNYSNEELKSGINNLSDLVDAMKISLDELGSKYSIPKDDRIILKRCTSFAKGQQFLRPSEKAIKDFLGLSQKGLESLTREMIYVGSSQSDEIQPATQQQLDLIDKAIRAFSPGKKNFKVFDARCGYGLTSSFLYLNKKSNENMEFYGIDSDPAKIIISRINALANNEDFNNYQCEDLLTTKFEKGPYDVVISDIPWGSKTKKLKEYKELISNSKYSKELEQCDTLDWVYALKMISALNKDGVGIWFTNSKSLTSSKNKQIVETIIKENLIASIIRLPKGSTSLNSTAPVMVIFKNGRRSKDSLIQVDARQFVQKGRKNIYLPVDEILSQATGKSKSFLSQAMNPSTMIADESEKEEILLKDVTDDIFRGTDMLTDDFISNHLSKGTDGYSVLRINDLTYGNTSISKESSTIALSEEEKEELDKYILKNGDILIKSRGNVNSGYPFSKEINKLPLCFVYNGNPQRIIATGSFMVVRPNKKKLDSNYLKFYLQSRIGVEELNLLGCGKNSFLLTKGSLGNLRLPMMELSKQEELGRDCLNYSMSIATAFNEFERKLTEFMNYLYERFKKGD